MYLESIPSDPKHIRNIYSLDDLLSRAENKNRASWKDLPREPGIYIVQWTLDKEPFFSSGSDLASHAKFGRVEMLQKKWDLINEHSLTNILYIGKGDNIRNRVRALSRFAVGKAKNHRGGEWLWQISQIRTAKLMIQTCPNGKQKGFEN